MTIGAAIWSWRRAAMNVVSFQWPWGVFPISRSPLGARLRKRVMFVLVPVSSMKTSCLGSIAGCLSRHSSRDALTSSRSCSAACSVFFKADPVTIEEAPQTRNAGGKGLVRSQTPTDFHQCQVRLIGDQSEQPVFVRLDRLRAPVTAGWLGLPATGFLETLCPADGAADTDFEHRTSAPARPASVHGINNTLTQISRIGARHLVPANRWFVETRSFATSWESKSSNSRFAMIENRSNAMPAAGGRVF